MITKRPPSIRMIMVATFDEQHNRRDQAGKQAQDAEADIPGFGIRREKF